MADLGFDDIGKLKQAIAYLEEACTEIRDRDREERAARREKMRKEGPDEDAASVPVVPRPVLLREEGMSVVSMVNKARAVLNSVAGFRN